MRNNNRRNSLLWHAMEEGTVSAEELSALAGWTVLESRTALNKAVAAELMARAMPKVHPATYGLTPKGIVEAQKVEREQVEFSTAQEPTPGTPPPTPTPAIAPAPAPEVTAAPKSIFADLLRDLGFDETSSEKPPVSCPVAPQSSGWAVSNDVPKVFEAEEDLVCAINSKGELVIDLGGTSNIVIQFPPKQAQGLQRFLDNTSVLAELSARGEL